MHHRDHILPCWSPIEWRNGYCHCVWGLYSMIVVCTDYMEHTDVVSVQLTHFQVFIGTCKFLYFAFSALTSNIDALTKLQYVLWNEGYQTHIICLQCLLTHCYYRIRWGQPLVTRVPMQPQHQGNVTTCHIGLHTKLFHEPPPHTWVLNY